MSEDWVFVGFPIDSLEETHIYIEQGDLFAQRCDTGHSVTDDSVCRISEDEIRKLLNEDSATFCSECVRHLSGLAMA